MQTKLIGCGNVEVVKKIRPIPVFVVVQFFLNLPLR